MLVDACDPDREGEAIFRRIVTHVGVSKPMRRLWVASLEEDAIRDALASMKDETEYQGLADSAMIRAKADWLIGMNASRAYSLVYNARFTVGRVQTPTLAMIVDRDRQIAGHVARPYWKVVAPMGGWKLAGERLDKREDAETLLRIVNSDDFAFKILKADRKQQHDAPPRLYDLTGLQKDMSRLHGLTAARTLTALQSLYEKKLATYPRTDSQYITHDDLDTLRGLTEGDRLVTGFIEPDAKPERPHLELTVNDAKVAGHTAILPTMQADKATLDELGDDERLVLVRVARRMWEAVGDDYVHDVTNVVANIDPHWCEKHPDEGRLLSEGECRFTSRSDQPVSLGWHAIEYDGPQEDRDAADETAGNIIPANLVTGSLHRTRPAMRRDIVRGKDETAEAVQRGDAARRDGTRQPLGGGQGPQGRIGRRRIPLGRHRHPGHARRRDREADPHRIRGPQGQAAALHGPGPFPDRRGRPEAQGRGIDRRHGTTPLGGRTRPGRRPRRSKRSSATSPRAYRPTRRPPSVRTMCRRRRGTRNRSAAARAAASPSSKRARCSNAPPTGARNNPTVHGGPRRDAAGAPGRPSPARPSPTRPCAGCSTAGRSASRASPRGRAARLTPRSSSTRTRASPSTSAITTRKGKRNDEFNLGSFVWGAVFLVAGLSFLSSSALVGILFLLLVAANLANTMSAQLDFVNQAGGRNSVKVSILEKDKLMQLAQNIQQLVFADVEGQRHQESMDMAQKQYTAQTNSVLIQQQMLDQQRKATADDNPSMPTE